jgi:Mycotoxin biosynthesis protein UstYa
MSFRSTRNSVHNTDHGKMYLRDAIKDVMTGKNVDDKLIHINHCYDSLRQSIQCRADDTLLYIPYRSRLTGDRQFRRCRDWKALTSWAQEHTACWPTGHCADLE